MSKMWEVEVPAKDLESNDVFYRNNFKFIVREVKPDKHFITATCISPALGKEVNVHINKDATVTVERFA